jgi:hypothetical protein
MGIAQQSLATHVHMLRKYPLDSEIRRICVLDVLDERPIGAWSDCSIALLPFKDIRVFVWNIGSHTLGGFTNRGHYFEKG